MFLSSKDVIIKASAPIALEISSFSSISAFGLAGDPTAAGFGVGELGGSI